MGYVASEDNLGPALLVITFLCLTISVLVVGARIGTKLWLQRHLGIDDLIIGISLVLSGIQSILISREISAGLGQRASTMSDDDIQILQKNQYAANLLYIASLALARVSVLIFVMQLSPRRTYKQISLGLIITISVWSLLSVFTLAFQCSIPKPWDFYGDRCLDRASLWTTIEAVNGTSDLAIVVLPTIILAHIQAPLQKRLIAISMFACRVLVIAIIIPGVVYIRQAIESTDVLYEWWKVVLLTQLIVATSITCSSMQYLKPFLDSIESGLIRADDGRRTAGSSKYGSKASPRYGSRFSQEAPGKRESQHLAIPLKRISVHRHLAGQGRPRRISDAESDGSESKIIQTRTFEVVSEPIDSIEQESMNHAS